MCCIIWCSMNNGSGIGPRGVITMGGLPGGTPMAGCMVGTGGGGKEGLSWGRGVGFLAEEGEQTAPLSEGEAALELEWAIMDEGPPPGDGALCRRSVKGVPQDSGVRSCTPVPPSILLSPRPCPGLHNPPGSAA